MKPSYTFLLFIAIVLLLYSFRGLNNNVCVVKIQAFNPEDRDLKNGFLIKTSGDYTMVRFSEKDNAYILKYEENSGDTLKLEVKEPGYLPAYISFKLTDRCKVDTIYFAITLNYLRDAKF